MTKDPRPMGPGGDSAAWLAAIVQSSNDAIISKTPQGIILSWSPGAERLFGYRADEAIGQPVTMLFPSDRLHEEAEFMRRIHLGERIDRYETVRVRKDHTPVEVSVTLAPIRGPDGSIAGVAKIARDITKQREADGRSRAQEERLRTTLRSIGDAVLTTDRDGRVTFLNPEAERLTGWMNAEGAGHPVDHVFVIVNETTGETAENPTTRALRDGVVAGLANHTLLIARDGTRHPIDDSAAPIVDEVGQIHGAVLVFRDITERRRQERDLQLLAAVVASSHDAIVSKTPDGIITAWSPGAEQMFGYPQGEAVGRHIKLIVPPERLAEEDAVLVSIRRGERVEPFETVRMARDGRRLDVELSVSPVRNEAGEIIGAAKIARDLTAQKEGAARLRAQEERLRTTLRSIGDAVITTDRDGHVTFLNAVAERLTGWTNAEAHGQPVEHVFAIVNETTGARVESPTMRALRDGVVVGLANHTLLIARDGTRRPIDDSAAPILDETGQSHGAVLVFRDITERRRREREVQLLAAVVASSHDAIISKTPDGIITAWSPGAERMFGYTSNEAVGRSIRLIIPPERSVEEDVVLASIRRDERVEPFETVRVTKDGRRIDVELSVSPVHDEAGEIIGAAKIARDIGDRRRAQEMRTALLERAEAARADADAANRMKDQFLAVLSHELRTPLNAMLGWTQMLRNRHVPSERTQHALDVIHRNTVLQARLIDELLDVARINAGKLHLEKRPVQLVPIIEDAIDVMHRDVAARDLVLGRHLDPEAGIILGDPTRLRQIVTNLLSNAVKFTPSGGRIDIRLDRDGDHARIVVTDTGIGIEGGDLAQIFEPFAQAAGQATARVHGGLGLGLGIVRHLVELHGGTVHAHSRGKGQGATFTVRLPIVAEPLSVADQTPPPAAKAERLDGIKVVIVEDDADAAEIATTVLQQHGAEVVTADCGERALSVLSHYHPDVLVCDIGLPDIDGYTLIQRVRDMERVGARRFVPSVAVTAFASEEDRRRALSAGYQRHVSKPVEPDHLVKVIAQVVASRR